MTEGTAVTQKKRCFVLSPIGSKDSPERKAADKVLKHLIRKSLGEGYTIERADESTNPGAITPAMIASILEADLIVADLTGHNPNVFYELAMAHGYDKPTVHVQKAGDKVPFDVKDMRIISYDMDPDDLEAAQKSLREAAKFVVDNPGKAETPLSGAKTFTAIQESTDPAVESNVLVLDAIQKLRTDVRRAFNTGRRRPTPNAISDRLTSDLESAKRIIDKVAADERAVAEDFAEAITPTTSTGFDAWLLEILQIVIGTDDEEELRLIYSREMDESHSEYWQQVYEDREGDR